MKEFLILLLVAANIFAGEFGKVYSGKANKPEENISSEFNYESKYLKVNGYNIHYIESGNGDPIIILHGIPTWSYLWRNVLDKVGTDKRGIAFDLLGYGKSDFPEDSIVSLDRQYQILKEFIEKMNFEKVTLVVNDLGSLVGLHYAGLHPEKINGLVLIEAAFMPAEEWYDQLTFMQKRMAWFMRKQSRAENWLINKNFAAKNMPKMFTKRKLTDEEIAAYTEPFRDTVRRWSLINGPGPTKFPKGMKSTETGDLPDIMNNYAQKLIEAEYPIHLIYAKKGMITRKEAVEYARENFKNYSEEYIGKGKHFLPESHPTAISESINNWYKNAFD